MTPRRTLTTLSLSLALVACMYSHTMEKLKEEEEADEEEVEETRDIFPARRWTGRRLIGTT